MKVLIVEPMRTPRREEIDGTLESMQKIVEGYIEFFEPFEDNVAIVCNEEGKVNNLTMNRIIYDNNGKPLDVICGTFFVIGIDKNTSDTVSLTEEQLKKYTQLFSKISSLAIL